MQKIDYYKIRNEIKGNEPYFPEYYNENLKEAINELVRKLIPDTLKYVETHAKADFTHIGDGIREDREIVAQVISNSILGLEKEILDILLIK